MSQIITNEPQATENLRKLLNLQPDVYGETLKVFADEKDDSPLTINCSWYDADVIAEICSFNDLRRTLGDVLIDAQATNRVPCLILYGDYNVRDRDTYGFVETILKRNGGRIGYIQIKDSGDPELIDIHKG